MNKSDLADRLAGRLRVLTHPALLVVDEIGYLPVNGIDTFRTQPAPNPNAVHNSPNRMTISAGERRLNTQSINDFRKYLLNAHTINSPLCPMATLLVLPGRDYQPKNRSPAHSCMSQDPAQFIVCFVTGYRRLNICRICIEISCRSSN